jgi:hypothetical protein
LYYKLYNISTLFLIKKLVLCMEISQKQRFKEETPGPRFSATPTPRFEPGNHLLEIRFLLPAE